MFKNINSDEKHLFVSRLPYVVLSLSLLLFSISILDTSQKPLDFSKLGLFSTLNYLFFISLYLLIISFFITFFSDLPRKNILLASHIFFLICMLFLLPVILEGTPRFNSTYVVGGEVEYILRNNYINPSVVRYHNWPLLHIFGAMVVYITDINLLHLLLFSPFMSQILYLFPLFCIFSLLFESRYKWLACFIFFLVNWLNQDYFSPQNYAYFLYLIFILTLLKYSFAMYHKETNFSIPSYKIILITILIVLPLSHALTSFISILTLFFIFIYFYFIENKKSSPTFFNLALICATVFVAWLLFGADFMFNRIVELFAESYGIDSTRDATLTLATKGSFDHSLVVYIRSISAALFFVLATVNYLFIYFIKKDFSVKNNIIFILVIAGSSLIFAGKYGGEIIIRVLLFSLIPYVYYSIKNLNIINFKILFIVFIMLTPSFNIVGHYGNEVIDYISPAEIFGANFFFKHALKDSLIVSPQSNLCDIRYIEQFKHTYTPELNSGVSPRYVLLTRRSEQKYSYFENTESQSSYESFKAKTMNLNKIYSNSNFQIML